ncbi:MAG: hypothetical protein HQ517_11300 [SAR324 cluster bacterium]|nr:hypothetical protein [SAR324 cluster bacterium]
MCSTELAIKHQNEYLKKVEALTKKVRKDPKKGMEVLIRAGIYDKKGNLTKPY